MSEYFSNDKLTELEKDIKTIPTDGEGRTMAVNYDEHFVRNSIIKLIVDLRESREEADKQKFRFEYTENLVRIAHSDRDEFKALAESQEILIQQYRGALGYSVAGHIKENPNIRNGIAEALEKKLYGHIGGINHE